MHRREDGREQHRQGSEEKERRQPLAVPRDAERRQHQRGRRGKDRPMGSPRAAVVTMRSQSAGWKAKGAATSKAAETSPDMTRSISTPRSSFRTGAPLPKSCLGRSTQNTLGDIADSR